MVVKLTALFLIGLGFLAGCKPEETLQINPEEKSKEIAEKSIGKLIAPVTGVDKDGNKRECVDQFNSDPVCTSVFTESDEFALECENDGNFPVMCGCHDWICVEKTEDNQDKLVHGFGRDGEPKSCEPFNSKDTMCTMEFTPEDQFALDCKEAGNTAVQCGCHDYLCVEE